MRALRGIWFKGQKIAAGFRLFGRGVRRACQLEIKKKKVLAIIINVGINIFFNSCQVDALDGPTNVPSGVAIEALPDNPGQVAITLSADYTLADNYEVRAYVGASPDGASGQTIPIALGETILTPVFSEETVYPRLYLLEKTTLQMLAQITLDPITITAPADVVAPVLSGVTAVATGTTTADVAVTTNDSSGHLYWAVTEGSTTPSVAELMSGTDAASGSQTVTAAGTQTVSVEGLESETGYTLHLLQTDAAGNASTMISGATFVTQSAPRPGSLTLNELSRDKSIFDSGAHLLPLEKKKVLGLATTAGSRWEGAYKVPGVDSLPTGVNYNARTKTVTVTGSFSGYLEGWDFTGNQVTWQTGQVKLRDCILGERDGLSDVLTYLDIYPAATVHEVAHNDIIGPNQYGGASPAILYRESAGNWPGVGADGNNPDGWVHHNKFTNLTEDAIKPTGGMVEYNAIIYDKNLDFAGQNVDPHSDAINPRVITEPLTIRRNYIAMSQRTDGLYKGANNAFRVVPNGSTIVPYQQALIYENVVIGAADAPSFLFSAETKGMSDYVGPIFANNWVRSNDQSVLYPTYGADMIWTGNVDLDTDALLSESEGRTTRNAITPTNRAQVPLSGKAPAGAVIQARAVSVGDDGATTTSWVDVATAKDSGEWSGILSAPRSTSWYRPEVRLKVSPGTTAQGTNRFAAGHVWARWGQSDEYHIWAFDGTVTPEAVTDDDALQIVFLERDAKDTTPQPAGSAFLKRITDASPGKPGFATMSNAIAAALPGHKVMVGLHFQSGMGVDERVNEKNNRRFKADEQQIQDIITADGTQVGVVNEFFSTGTPTQIMNSAAMGPIQFGINPDGSTFTAPGIVPGAGDGQPVSWTLTDFYNWDYTKFSFQVNIDDAGRDNMKAMALDPVYARFFTVSPNGPKGFGGWLKGELNAAGTGFNDESHPGINDERGAAQMASVLTYAAMAQIGLVPGGYPVINTVELHPNGNSKVVALGWTGGEMTTTRRTAGRPRLTGNAKYTDVKNIGWNGANIRAEIRDEAGNLADRGRIWLYKNDNSNWSAGDIPKINISDWASVDKPAEIINGWQFDDMPCGVIAGSGAVPVYTADSPADLFTNYTAYPPRRQGINTRGGTLPGSDGGGGAYPADDNTNPNVAATAITDFNSGYWQNVSGWTPNGDGILTVDMTNNKEFSNIAAGSGKPRIDIDPTKLYEIRIVITATNPGQIGLSKTYGVRDNGFGAVSLLGAKYQSFPGGNVPTEIIWTTTDTAAVNRRQMMLYFKKGSGSSGTAKISDLTVKVK